MVGHKNVPLYFRLSITRVSLILYISRIIVNKNGYGTLRLLVSHLFNGLMMLLFARYGSLGLCFIELHVKNYIC